MGWAIRKFMDLAMLGALVAILAGGAVLYQLASNGGNALGQGLGGAFTFVSSMGGGWQDYQDVENSIKKGPADKATPKSKAQ
jgi:hypothetical protein